jgi:hypothetical protein
MEPLLNALALMLKMSKNICQSITPCQISSSLLIFILIHSHSTI